MVDTRNRRLFLITGTVQGVGFRPFVFRLAKSHGLDGWVRNDTAGVQIDVEGPIEGLEAFAATLKKSPPPRALVRSMSISRLEPVGADGFRILDSQSHAELGAMVPPDIATCHPCRAELSDPDDRRFGYPFINCTNCGPRYTIVQALPYDRPLTTMAGFPLCDLCRAEYEDPTDRRFHAQPNACPDCGPAVTLLDAAGRPVTGDPMARARELLKGGRILAVKGLGGFHLACHGALEKAVQRLRVRKGREEKPFAVMVSTIENARAIATFGLEEERLLASPEAPIVLMPQRPGHGLAPSVAPRNRFFGVMLPYTPLHQLLLQGGYPALVMTSGNLTDEPMAYETDDAVSRLGKVADAFLVHNRPIEIRADDSVVRVVANREVVTRRSRGYVPRPVFLPRAGPPVLAVGADLKNAVCLTFGDAAFLGHHIGDLEHFEALVSFRESIDHLSRLLSQKPAIVAHDMHPGYASTRYATGLEGATLVPVQHHHAHAASVMAENGVTGPVVAATLDGTGYGTDGTVWGGEFLLCDLASFQRKAHLEAVPLPGGDAGAREGWRMAVAYLHRTYGWDDPVMYRPFLGTVEEDKVAVVLDLIRSGLNTPRTTSMGRLFDAVSALSGVAPASRFEGQAAIELEGAADPGPAEPYSFRLVMQEETRIIKTDDLVRGVCDDVAAGCDAGLISARFHKTVVDMVVSTCRVLAVEEGLDQVALSGGCFQNALLLEGAVQGLASAGLRVYTHSQVPPNDGGLALGQAAVALERKSRCVSPFP